MEITNLKSDHEWQHLPCQKNESCFHCKCKKQYDSIPKENFSVKEFDKDGNFIGDREISKIKIIYKDKDEVIGWVF